MGTIAEKLAYTANAKNCIRTAIVDKGVACPSSAAFGTYGEYISQISGQGFDTEYKFIVDESDPGTRRLDVVRTTFSAEATGATEITGTIDAEAGDIVLATIVARSALTLPSSLELLHTSDPIGSNQTLSFAYHRVSAAGEQTFVVQQASAGRLYLTLVVLKKVQGVEYAPEYEVSGTGTLTSPVVKPTGARLIWGCSSEYWTGGKDWATNLVDYDNYEIPVASNPRLGTITDFFDSSVAAEFTSGSSEYLYNIGAVKVLTNESVKTGSYKLVSADALLLSGGARQFGISMDGDPLGVLTSDLVGNGYERLFVPDKVFVATGSHEILITDESASSYFTQADLADGLEYFVNTTDGMTYTEQDSDGTNVSYTLTKEETIFTLLDGSKLNFISPNGDSYFSFNGYGRDAQLNYRDNWMRGTYKQLFQIADIKCLKLRWSGYAPYSNRSADWLYDWELFLFSTGDAMICRCAAGQYTYFTGANSFLGTAYTLPSFEGDCVTFYRRSESTFEVANEMFVRSKSSNIYS